MGRILGSSHTKKRVYLTEESKKEMVELYNKAIDSGVMLTQAMLATKFGVTQVGVGKILRAAGCHTRTPHEASPVTFDVGLAVKLYTEDTSRTLESIGIELGVAWTSIRTQLMKRGVEIRKCSEYPIYDKCNRSFFAIPDPISAYFAGFIAADGSIAPYAKSVDFGVHPKDRCILENLSKAANLDQPIKEYPNNSGRVYSWLHVSSIEWVHDLEKHYNIVNAKSLILKPPNITDQKLIWHFIRGYFDGDGHASINGTMLNFISGSPAFFDWLLEHCGKTPGHIQTHTWETEAKGKAVSARSAFYTGDAARLIALNMYRDSTPDTRLERKFLRLKNNPESLIKDIA